MSASGTNPAVQLLIFTNLILNVCFHPKRSFDQPEIMEIEDQLTAKRRHLMDTKNPPLGRVFAILVLRGSATPFYGKVSSSTASTQNGLGTRKSSSHSNSDMPLTVRSFPNPSSPYRMGDCNAVCENLKASMKRL